MYAKINVFKMIFNRFISLGINKNISRDKYNLSLHDFRKLNVKTLDRNE